MTTKNKRFGPLSAALLTLGLMAACSGSGDIRNSAATVVTAGAWSVFDLRLGDCIAPDGLAASDSDEVLLVPCTEAHEWEVFGVVTHPDAAYPGDAAVATFADQACLSLLTKSETQQDATAFTYLLPTKDGWDERDDRVIVCVVRELALP